MAGNLRRMLAYDFSIFLFISVKYRIDFPYLRGIRKSIGCGYSELVSNKLVAKYGGRARISFSWLLSAVGHAIAFVLLVLGLVVPANRNPYNWSCDLTSLFGVKYILFITAFSCLAGLVSTILTLSALSIGLYQFRKLLPLSNDEAGRVRKQVQLAKSTMTISSFDLALVTLPSLFCLLTGYVKLPAFIRVQNSTYTYAINCMMVLLALMAFNRRFRRSSAQVLRIGKLVAFVYRLLLWMKHWCCGENTNVASLELTNNKVAPILMNVPTVPNLESPQARND